MLLGVLSKLDRENGDTEKLQDIDEESQSCDSMGEDTLRNDTKIPYKKLDHECHRDADIRMR